MSDYAIVADTAGCAWVGMDNGIVLDIGSSAHGDGVGIAPKNGPKPEGGILRTMTSPMAVALGATKAEG